ncbi:serine hydrolase domain-containing protein [Roseateles sp. BYS78W]|uniref:Serine hydrolase domain-containing protein n=1 Tax=Pelomonas candidula TaxID=3299025 RepID=A0ABW7HAP5_9BURK
MLFRALVLSTVAALTACGGGNSESSPQPQAQARLQQAADGAIVSGLAGVAIEHLSAADTTQALAGLRQVGATPKVQAGDAFMIGSTTKAMTSALAGRLVEQGRIGWATTLADALPDLAAAMKPVYRGITLEQLLSHRGGLPAFTGVDDVARFQAYLLAQTAPLPATPLGRERFFAAWLLAQDPPTGVTPGQTFVYSNAGYALAALMLETRTGRAFADLFEQELAKPLGMTVTWTLADATFVNRPVGHVGARGGLKPLPPEDADTAAWLDVLRASGQGTTISPDSYATWVRWHLRALRGEVTPLPSSYVQRLQALKAGDYALGWIAADIDGRAVLVHNGADRGFSSLLVVDTRGRSASFAFTNSEADDGAWVLSALNETLLAIERALPPTT